MDATADFDFREWRHFTATKPFKMYIDWLKEALVGQPLCAIYTMSVHISNYEHELDDAWDSEGSLKLGGPIVFAFGEHRLDICFHDTSHAKVGVHTMAMTEPSCQQALWRDVGRYFKKIAGHALADIILTTGGRGLAGGGNRPDDGDYFGSLFLVMECGNTLELRGQAGYMEVTERLCEELRLFPSDVRLRADGCIKEGEGTDFLSFTPAFHGVHAWHEAVHIFEDDFDALHWAIRSVIRDFDIYEDADISIADWARILDAWRFICEAEAFDDVFECLCGIDYANHHVSDTSFLYFINNTAAQIWKKRNSEWHLYDNFRIWFDKQKGKCTHIQVSGI